MVFAARTTGIYNRRSADYRFHFFIGERDPVSKARYVGYLDWSMDNGNTNTIQTNDNCVSRGTTYTQFEGQLCTAHTREKINNLAGCTSMMFVHCRINVHSIDVNATLYKRRVRWETIQ